MNPTEPFEDTGKVRKQQFDSPAWLRFTQVWAHTFALQALAEQALEQLLAVLADSGARVGVDDKRVRHLDFGQQDLVELDRAADVRLWVGAPSSREHVFLLQRCKIEVGRQSVCRTCMYCWFSCKLCSLWLGKIGKHSARLIRFGFECWSHMLFFSHHEHTKVACVKLHPERTLKTSLAL